MLKKNLREYNKKWKEQSNGQVPTNMPSYWAEKKGPEKTFSLSKNPLEDKNYVDYCLFTNNTRNANKIKSINIYNELKKEYLLIFTQKAPYIKVQKIHEI